MSAGPESWATLALAVSVGAAAVAVWLAARVRVLARHRSAAGGDPMVLDRVVAAERALAAASRRLEHLASRVDQVDEHAQRGLQRVGIVRYDAFKELGGHLSFSLALLDARRDGVVISVLNDRDGARAYAKPVTGGRSTYALSEEEQRAITEA
ncbi:MAG: DUF4446 family protein [Armatimonadetes bacterium]|nr:DUF4446 family protein [Armatimonadota bacterium]